MESHSIASACYHDTARECCHTHCMLLPVLHAADLAQGSRTGEPCRGTVVDRERQAGMLAPSGDWEKTTGRDHSVESHC